MNKQVLIPLVERVAELRDCLGNIVNDKLALYEKMKESPEGQEYEGICKDMGKLTADLMVAETELKERSLALYEKTKEKKPIDKVEIKIFKSLEYDALEALDWCRRNSPALLMVNKKPFEKAAVEIGAPVRVTEKAKCTIGTDLSAYLNTRGEVKKNG